MSIDSFSLTKPNDGGVSFGSGSPSVSGVEGEGDAYINLSNGECFKFLGGAWVSQGTISVAGTGQIRPTTGYTTVTPLTINGASRQVPTARQIIATVEFSVDDAETETIGVQISPDNSTWDTIVSAYLNFDVTGILVGGDTVIRFPITFELPDDWYYRFTSSGSGSSSIERIREREI